MMSYSYFIQLYTLYRFTFQNCSTEVVSVMVDSLNFNCRIPSMLKDAEPQINPEARGVHSQRIKGGKGV